MSHALCNNTSNSRGEQNDHLRRAELRALQIKRRSYRCMMSIFWNIGVSKEGAVKTKLDLLMKMPEQAEKLDTENVMASAPESFRRLLSVFGEEATIESLIQSVCF
ncbi:centromere protein P [Silurus asotus]|uniref:Centromere protein P n=1 Tax=Silurus asotus TaxID=30991 RepID=A0AAD5F8S3_SILAS|nr:centromere protein P [Silurus asotus]